MKKIFYAILACAGLTLAACSLDEYNPREVTGDETLATYEGLYGMQALCYKPIWAQIYTAMDFYYMAECGTDMWWITNDSDNNKELFAYDGLVPFSNKGWDKAFTQLYSALGNCNTIISRAETVTGNEEAVATLKAEALFLRGYYHLLLTTYYGPITLVLQEPSESPVLAPKRNTLSEIYKSITSDLKAAAEVLKVTPFENNRQRATKLAALGMLARAYVQGAGQGLTEEGTSYWALAKKTAEEMINTYGSQYMYADVDELWADYNNRSNKEVLFRAAGPDACNDANLWAYATAGQSKLFIYTYPDLSNVNDISNIANNKNGTSGSHAYGRLNEAKMAPSKYLVDVFDASWDKRWENSFQTAFGRGTFLAWGGYPGYAGATLEITEALCEKYGIDKKHVGKKTYPYYNAGDPFVDADFNPKNYSQGGNQYTVFIWPKGDTSGDYTKLLSLGTGFKKAYVIDPTTVTPDENRLFLYLSKEKLTAAQKAEYLYPVVNIDDLMVDGERYVANATEFGQGVESSNLYKMFPSFNKFQWSFDGVYNGGNLQIKNGDMFAMRMAEMYLIAAECYAQEGNGAKAAEYLNVLRNRAKRSTYTGSVALSSASLDDVFDEYARELCGEFSRWALLQRHQALKSRLEKYNKRAAANFKDYHVWRPISQDFLQQIDNAEEYGDNGYGTTAKSGLDGYLD